MPGVLEWMGKRNLKQRIGEGIRINLVPGLVLWVMGVCLVAIYYLGEFSRPWFNEIKILKETYGFVYSAVSTSFFGGLIGYDLRSVGQQYNHIWVLSILALYAGFDWISKSLND